MRRGFGSSGYGFGRGNRANNPTLIIGGGAATQGGGTPSYGPELVVDGVNFATGYSNVRNTNVSGGTLNATGSTSPAASLALTTAVTAGLSYKIEYDITSYTSGSGVVFTPGGGGASTTRQTAVGHYSETVVSGGTLATLSFACGVGTVLSVDNVSCKQVL